MRSDPGTGKQVRIYMGTPIHESGFVDPFSTVHNKTEMYWSEGEDYARCPFPVCVKADPSLSREELIQTLRDIADRIEEEGQEDPGTWRDLSNVGQI